MATALARAALDANLYFIEIKSHLSGDEMRIDVQS